jgi:hypothetical protein
MLEKKQYENMRRVNLYTVSGVYIKLLGRLRMIQKFTEFLKIADCIFRV